MNEYFLRKLKRDLAYDNLKDLLKKYDCFMRGNTLFIYKAIPVTDFIKIRKEIRDRKRVDNIIVEG